MRVLYYFIVVLARVLNIAILIRVFLTWIPISRDNPVVSFIYEITEPILGPIRRVLPPVGGLDFSPLVALVLIEVAERVLLTILARLM
ncbi:MAG: YggT family protein [Anaerolineae bacterium]|nr:YggT family protein [Anaerolineae bacterium]